MIDREDPIATLRERAESKLRRELARPLGEFDELARTVYELEVHQAELEMQNEELRRAKEELEGVRDRHTSLLDRAPIGFLTVNQHGVVTASNRVAGELLGVPAAALHGRRLVECFAGDDRRALRLCLSDLFGRGGEASRIEARRAGSRGKSTKIALEAHLRWLDGAREAWIALTDLSRERTAEALSSERDFAERLLDIAPLIALELDANARVSRFNRYFQEISGYPAGEIHGADFFTTFLPSSARADAKVRFARPAAAPAPSTPHPGASSWSPAFGHASNAMGSGAGGARSMGVVIPILTKSGEERLVEWHDAPILGDEHGYTTVLVIGRDVTEATRLEEKVRHAQKMEAMGTLATGVAHDFNNLLMGIVGGLDLAIRRAEDPARVRPLLEMIRDHARVGTATVEQLMAFSRHRSVDPVERLLDEVVEDVAGMLRVALGEDIELDVQLDCAEGRVCLGPGQIEQVVTNLALNARYAMPRGGRLSLRTSAVALGPHAREGWPDLVPGSFLRLEVEDTGSGMDEATRKRAFEPFFTTKAGAGGTGLGLATVYGIIRGAGGRVELTSSLGVGTRFRIDLPRVRDSAPGEPIEPSAHPGHGETVLVVEDEAFVRLTIRHYLERGGYAVIEAKSATEALEIIFERGAEIDVMLSDVVLPGSRGPEFALRLREIAPDLPVQWMSAHPAELARQRSHLPPSVPVLQKPFEPGRLLAMLEGLLDVH